MFTDIFESDKEKEAGEQAVAQLVNHEGWKVLQRFLDANIKHFRSEIEETLHNPIGTIDPLQLVRFQDRIDDLEGLKSLPAILIADQDAQEEDSEEVYDLPEEEEDKKPSS